MRLDKLLSDMGAGTRSDIKKLVRSGKVSLNGETVRDPGTQVADPGAADILVEGRPVAYEPFVYYMLNKPSGVVSASEDRHQRTVLDLIREGEKSAGRPVRTDLFPVGRLDKDTEGLLIVTNDGEMAHQLLSPRHHVDKVYDAVVSGRITQEDVRRFEQGIRYDETLTAMPAQLKILSVQKTADRKDLYRESGLAPGDNADQEMNYSSLIREENEYQEISRIEVTIREGKFHQIRKMVSALGGGKEVLYLKRLSMGPVGLDPQLKPGQYRRLTGEETERLRSASKGR